MSQATIERPVSQRRAAGSTAKLAPTPRENICLQLAKLQGLIALMVETDQGDCAGRVFEHAGKGVLTATEFFSSGDIHDVETSYEEMLQADSFIQAAGALVAQDFNVSGRGYTGRTMAADTIVNLSAEVTTAIDTNLMEMRKDSGERAAPPPAQSGPEESAGIVTAGDAEARRQLALEASWQIETLSVMLRDQAQQEDNNATRLTLSMVVKATCLRIEQLNGQIMTVCSSSCDNEPTAGISRVVHGD